VAVIHPTALVHPGARIAEDVEIGPYCVIGEHVEIGAGSVLRAHVVVSGHTRMGRNTRIYPFACLGEGPQDKKYRGEPTRLEIGDDNTIRECCTLNLGTTQDAGVTRVGDNNWIMAYAHIAHDCQVGSNVVLANASQLAGHVFIGDHVILGGGTLVHQFCRIGAHAFIGMGAFVNGDVPPYLMVAQEDYGRPRGINSEGLKRRGFDAERIAAIKRAYRALYMSGKPLAEVREQLAQGADQSQDVRLMLEFIERSERGLLR
jgi:UDP-N-acetylglucosamine acyltransferase